MTGADMIAAERQRQITKKGWTAEHDDAHSDGELVSAALAYLYDSDYWPWNLEWFKPSRDADGVASIRDLVKAGALIAAEIDRLQRIKHG